MTSLIHELYVNDVIVNHIHKGMKALYKESLRLNGNDSIIVFQESLRKVKDLSQMNLEEDYNGLIETAPDEEFIDRVFELTFRNVVKHYIEAEKGYVIEDIRDLPSSYLNMPRDNIRLLHLITLECARGIYTKANLYCTKYSEISLQDNYEKAKEIIRKCVIKAIRKRIDLSEIYDYYTRPKTPEQQIETDFHKYVSETQKDVPDRLDWKQEEEVKEITYDPEEKIEESDDEDSSYKMSEDEELKETDTDDEPDEPDEHDEPEEASDEPEEASEGLEEPDVLDVLDEHDEHDEPEEASEGIEEPREPETLEELDENIIQKYRTKELKDPNKLNITLLDKKVDL